MADATNNSGGLPVGGGIAVVIAMIAGYFVVSPPSLDGARPEGLKGKFVENIQTGEDVRARLWEDPFAAVLASQGDSTENISLTIKDKSKSGNKAVEVNAPAKFGQQEKSEHHSLRQLMGQIISLENDRLLRSDESKYATKIDRVKKTFIQLSEMSDQKKATLQQSINTFFDQRKKEQEQVIEDEKKLKKNRRQLNEAKLQSQTNQKDIKEKKETWNKAKEIYTTKETEYQRAKEESDQIKEKLSEKQTELEKVQTDVYRARKKIESLLFDIQGLERRKENQNQQLQSLEVSASTAEKNQKKTVTLKTLIHDVSLKIEAKKHDLEEKQKSVTGLKKQISEIRGLDGNAEKKKNEASKYLNEAKRKKLQSEQDFLLVSANSETIKAKKNILAERIADELKQLESRRQSIAAYTEKFESAATRRNAARDVIRKAKEIVFRLESREPFVINDVFHGKYAKLTRSDSKGISNEFLLELDRILNSRSAYPEQVGNVESSKEDKDNQPVVSLMFAMVPGGPYAEDMENRLRYRYAIVSSLAAAGYQPRDSMHIGYVRSDLEDVPKVIPYELYVTVKKDDNTKDKETTSKSGDTPILLMWLDNAFFQKKPIKRLRGITSQMVERLEPLWREKPIIDKNVKIIGPSSSDVFLALIESDQLKTEKQENEKNLIVFSPSASIKVNGNKKKMEKLNAKRVKLTRTIMSDNKLTQALVKELRNRIQNFDSKRSKVALISEWDTSYGRALPGAFSESMCNDNVECRERIHKYTYMRGIDGKIPKNDSDQNASKSFSKAGEVHAIHVELPVGKSQVDYLRRMADDIGRLDSKLKHNDRSGGIKAIGILGSDVFDKLLIIRALRERFPKAIFFTTDLDANLLHPDNLKWTRNLIVASSYGLRLNGLSDLQKDKQSTTSTVPPFRSVYQTSTYFSVLLALGAINPPEDMGLWIEKTQARMFEVGRNGAVELGRLNGSKVVEDASGTGSAAITIWVYRVALALTLLLFVIWYNRWRLMNARFRREENETSVNRFQKSLKSPHTYVISMTVVLAFAGSVVASWEAALLGLYLVQVVFAHQMSRYIFEHNRKRCIRAMNGDRACGQTEGQFDCQENCSPSSSCPSYRPVLLESKSLVVISAFILLIVGAVVLIAGSAEPFSVFDGISIWPTEVLRWLAALIGGGLLYRGWKFSKWNLSQVGKEFKFGSVEAISEKEPENSILQVWRSYVKSGDGWKRFWRILPIWLAYFALCLIIIKFDEPFVPYRGAGTSIIDFWSTMIAVWVYTFMIFAIVDAIMLCRNFINQLIRIDTIWPCSKEHADSQNRSAEIAAICRREWNEIRLIARRTQVISRLVYYPIVVALIMIASRSSYFDHWSTPPGLALVIGFSVFLVVCCAILLRRKAVQAEEYSLENLEKEKEKLLNAGHKPDCEWIEQIDFYSGRIKDIKTGAFLPITEQPWVQAVSLLLGGGGTLILFDVLSLAK